MAGNEAGPSNKRARPTDFTISISDPTKLPEPVMAVVVESLEELAPALRRLPHNKKQLAKSQKQKHDGEIPQGFRVKPISQMMLTEAGQTVYDARS